MFIDVTLCPVCRLQSVLITCTIAFQLTTAAYRSIAVASLAAKQRWRWGATIYYFIIKKCCSSNWWLEAMRWCVVRNSAHCADMCFEFKLRDVLSSTFFLSFLLIFCTRNSERDATDAISSIIKMLKHWGCTIIQWVAANKQGTRRRIDKR